jgi:predicted RNA-binding protein YlxR (DUF448 family)
VSLPNRQSRQPQRTCIACRQAADQNSLVRYVLAPDGQPLVDYRHKLPGRGTYTCLTRECMEAAVDRNQFQRSFRGRGTPPGTNALMDSLLEQIVARIEGLIGMARKSSQVESGSNAVLGSLKQNGKFGLLIVSEDISGSIGEKLTTAAARQGIPVFKMLEKDRLGLLLGKGERSVAAISSGTLADAILVELQRLAEMVREN